MSVNDMLEQMRGYSVRKGPSCAAGLAYSRLSSQEQAAFKEAMKDDTILAAAISKWLLEKGYQVRPHTMARHRRLQCGCER